MFEHFLIILAAMALLLIFAWGIRDAGELNREHGRNLELEHKLGGHREVAAWGCKACQDGKA